MTMSGLDSRTVLQRYRPQLMYRVENRPLTSFIVFRGPEAHLNVVTKSQTG